MHTPTRPYYLHNLRQSSSRITAFAALTLLCLSACDPAAQEPLSIECGTPTINTSTGEYFYEIYDLTTGTVWGTPFLTPEEFDALELPEGWAKNQVREPALSDSAFLRSPGCANDGEFTEEELFGVEFQHVVDFVGAPMMYDEQGLLNGSQVFKYHQIGYASGQTISILADPDGARHILVSRDAARASDTPSVPSGWTLDSYTLAEDLTIDLFGTIDNIRADNQDSFQGPIPESIDLDAIATRQSIRGVRTCELMELTIVDDMIAFAVWNEGFLHDCPDSWLDSIDRTVYGVFGPRWRSIDAIAELDASDNTIGAPERVIAEVPNGLGLDMVFAADVPFLPVATLEQQLDITIDTIEDIPAPVRQNLLDNALASQQYVEMEILRAQFSRMTHHAGSRIFTLSDGQCRYAMKFYTNVVDPELDNEDAIAELGNRFTQLPAEFTFEVITLEEDLVVTELDGTAHVIADEFGNSYDRFECN